MGELGDLKNLNLNAEDFLKSFSLAKLDFGKCVIPGFNPPTLPEFTIPPLPLFGGIPPFPLFCGLPPFPGIPALSLPGISIPIPPIPFLPPIPLPIPLFSLPLLPRLPRFDLGSISFLCGLINIDLPILDPFAELNRFINQLNGFINAFNSFLNFCRRNAETINATEVIAEPPPSIDSFPPLTSEQTPLGSSARRENGLGSVPKPVTKESTKTSRQSTKQTSPKIDLTKLNFRCDEPATNLAQYLANAGAIVPEQTNKVSRLLSRYSSPCELTSGALEQLLLENNISSKDGFIGFSCAELDILLPVKNSKELIDKMIAAKILCTNKNVVAAAFKLLSKLNLASISCLELASSLNSGGIPYGELCTNLVRLTSEDLARAFFISPTTAPLTPEKIVAVLKRTAVIDSLNNNPTLAVESLSPLPEPLDPTTLANRLIEVNVGPAVGTLKGMCIAFNQGLNINSLVEINLAKSENLLEATRALQGSSLLVKLQRLTKTKLEKIIDNYQLVLPLSIYEIIPILSIEFEVDDKAFFDLFALFKISGTFEDVEELFRFFEFIATTLSSSTATLGAIKTCERLKEGDFVFSNWSESIARALRKYQIVDFSEKEKIANALRLELKLDYKKTLEVLNSKTATTNDELAFLLLACGVLRYSQNQLDSESYENLSSESSRVVGFNPIGFALSSPTGRIADILEGTIEIVLNTRTTTLQGTREIQRIVVEDGIAKTGTSIAIFRDDFQQILNIKLLGVASFDGTREGIESIVLNAKYLPSLGSQPRSIPPQFIRIG